MPWFRATIIDRENKVVNKEFYCGCGNGAKQELLKQYGINPHGQQKVDIIVKDIYEIEPK